MRQLQNDQEKIGSFYQNHRSNIPPDSALTYGLINTFEARALWNNQVPYVESDTMPIIVRYITRMLFVAEPRADFGLLADVSVVEG